MESNGFTPNGDDLRWHKEKRFSIGVSVDSDKHESMAWQV